MAEQYGAVTVQWSTTDALRTGTIQITATGVDLDAALDALLAGVDDSAVGYTVTRALKVVTTEEDYRPRPALEARGEATPTVRVSAPDLAPDPPARPSRGVQVVRGKLR